MTKKIDAIIDNLIIICASIELLMGIMSHTVVTLQHSRYILMFFTFVYLGGILGRLKQYSRTELLVLFVSELLIGVPLYFISGINYFIKAILFIFCLKRDISFYKRMLSSFFLCSIIGLVIALITAMAGRAPLYINDTNRNSLRYSFGFQHGNTWAFMFYLQFVLGIFYFRGIEKTNSNKFRNVIKLVLIIFEGINVIGLLMTKSRTGIIIYIFTLVIYLLMIKWKNNQVDRVKTLCNIYRTGIILLTVLSILLSILIIINPEYYQEWSWGKYLFLGRIGQLRSNTTDIAAPLGGINSWKLYSSKECINCYDLGYITMFYRWGIIPTLSLVAFLLYSSIGINMKHSCYEAVYQIEQGYIRCGILVMIGFSIYNFMEAYLISNYLTLNIWLVCAAMVMWLGRQTSYGSNVLTNS